MVSCGPLLDTMTSMPRLRPATLDDAAIAARIMTSVLPDEPWDADVVRFNWSIPEKTMVRRRFIVEERGEPVGLAYAHNPAAWTADQPHFGRVNVTLAPGAQDPDDYDQLLGELTDQLVGAGAEAFQSHAREDEEFVRAGLERNGFRLDRLSKAWELDLVSNRDRLLAERAQARARMGEVSVEMLPLSAITAPDTLPRLYELDVQTTQDIPHTVPFVDPTYEEWVAGLENPDVRRDRFWTAWREGDVIALSFLRYPKVGVVWTGYTACRRDQRGQGIARAVKMETLGQAIELGVERVRTDNDEQNAPMLHINEELGYYRIPGSLSYLRP